MSQLIAEPLPRNPVVFIAGPTASGKSALALRLAARRPCVVINADALQVYEGLPILTAQPRSQDHGLARHRLYGVVAADQPYSAGQWRRAVIAEIHAAHRAGLMPVVIGGTGLYFRALEAGMAEIPPIPPEMRQYWRARLDREGAAALHARLSRDSPQDAARISPNDGQRVVRALEVLMATGRPLIAYHDEKFRDLPLEGVAIARLALTPDRQELYRRAETRFEHMIAEGALAEVAALLKRFPDRQTPVMKAIGAGELADHLEGRLSLDEAVCIAKRRTRNYIKRQMTWIRTQMPHWPRCADAALPVHFTFDHQGCTLPPDVQKDFVSTV